MKKNVFTSNTRVSRFNLFANSAGDIVVKPKDGRVTGKTIGNHEIYPIPATKVIMNQLRYKLRLMVCGDFIPEQLTNTINISPTSVIHSGERFPSPLEDRTYKYNFWSLEIPYRDNADVFDCISDTLASIDSHSSEWVNFIEDRNADASIVGSLFLQGDSLSISPDNKFLELLLKLRISLDFSVEAR